MNALQRTDAAPIILHFPTLYTPPTDPTPAPTAHTSANRVRKPAKQPKSNPGQRELWSGVPDAVLALAQTVQREIRRDRPTPEQLDIVRQRWPLRQYWTEFIRPDQARRVAAGELSRNTLNHTRDALSGWEQITRPADWPAKADWPGFPIGLIEAEYLTQTLARYATGRSPATVRSWWGHLRTIFNHAVGMQAIPTAPKPELPTMPDQPPRILTDKQIEAIYLNLTGQVALQVAFVTAINTGLRPVDLFCLRWADLDWEARSVTLTARKTGKRQTIPLAPITLRQIGRLRYRAGLDPYIFCDLADPTAPDPERSRPARQRNAAMQAALAQCGYEIDKPWQTCRATCNTRLERHAPGVGKFVLGHSLGDVNAKHYFEPTQTVTEAINTIPQPPCFLQF